MWEGAEICYYINGESYTLPLSDTQFAIVGKILGLQIDENEIKAFSDETLRQLAKMKGNPLRLVERKKDQE